MKAIKVHELGGPDELQVEEIDKPSPKVNEVLIEVHASSLNPVDAKSIEPNSRYSTVMPLPVTPGMDIAGVIESVGFGVTDLRVGDRVFGQASALRKGTGAFAEYAITPVESLSLMPANISFIEAASVPLAASSAYQALVDHIKLHRDEHILIHGGSGGIGSFAIQLAKHLGAAVTTTASGEGVEFCKQLGADHVIDYKTTRFYESGRIYDSVLDTIGGSTYTDSFKVVKEGGMIASMLEEPDKRLMDENGVQADLVMTRVDSNVLAEIARLIEEGVLTAHVAMTFPLERTREAYKVKEREKILGKIVIDVRGGETDELF